MPKPIEHTTHLREAWNAFHGALPKDPKRDDVACLREFQDLWYSYGGTDA